jgi:hypothetical protein
MLAISYGYLLFDFAMDYLLRLLVMAIGYCYPLFDFVIHYCYGYWPLLMAIDYYYGF